MAVSTSLPSSSSVTKLEPFLLLAKSAKGAAAAKLVHEATAAPGCYVFAELAECEGVREVRMCCDRYVKEPKADDGLLLRPPS